jgi:hypothetical protein
MAVMVVMEDADDEKWYLGDGKFHDCHGFPDLAVKSPGSSPSPSRAIPTFDRQPRSPPRLGKRLKPLRPKQNTSSG